VSYLSLAPVKLTAAADQTGANPGNWTNAFMAAAMPLVNPQYEIYHMTVIGGSPLAGGVIYVGLTNPWSTVQLDINGTNEWDPSEPLILTSGQEIYVLWNTPVTGGDPPVVTIFPRYDPAVAGAA
jgi:hypothetical protein